MSRALKTSGFLALTIQMLWGIYNVSILAGGDQPPAWLIGAHAHLGVLSILAVVLGFAVDHYGLDGSRRQIVTYGYIVGQWLLPVTIIVAFTTGMMQLELLNYLWGLILAITMAIMTLEAWNDAGGTGSTI